MEGISGASNETGKIIKTLMKSLPDQLVGPERGGGSSPGR